MKCKLINENFRDNYFCNLLKSRGINNIEEYLNPTSISIQDPLFLDYIHDGLVLLTDYINNNKKITIIVDCDNDGYTSAAIMYNFIKDINENANVSYLLHEHKDHGLSDLMDYIVEHYNNIDLIIQPDSGSNDYIYHEKLKDYNILCLVLDHHIFDTKKSDNAIIINNTSSKKYKNKDLTGAGVVYQFCRYYDYIFDTNYASKYIDLAAWGIIGDMGKLNNPENRYIVYHGLKNIQNKLLISLIQKQSYSITGKMNIDDKELFNSIGPDSISFYITPLINAITRVGTIKEKEHLFEAFLNGDKEIESNKRGAKGQIVSISEEVFRESTNARNRQNKLLDQFEFITESRIYKYDLLSNKVLFIRLEQEDNFPSELNGLLAMKLSAKYKRPTIVARLNQQGYNRGSMRGLNQSELQSFKEFLEESNMFEYVEGHDNAAGCSILDSKLHDFHKYANNKLENINLDDNYYSINFERIAADKDIELIVQDLEKGKNIWGQGMQQPLIHIKDINLNINDIQIIGKNKDTIKFEKFGITYIKFKAKDLIEKLNQIQYSNIKISLIGKTNINEWMGNITPQIIIESLEYSDGTYEF